MAKAKAKTHRLQNLIEKIGEADKMIKLHASNPSKFMLKQYEAKKEKLLGYLIDDLVAAKLRSPYSFRLILLALKKFYPELAKHEDKKTARYKHYRELKSLESVLA